MEGLLWTIALLACVFVLALGGLVGGLVSLVWSTARPRPGRPFALGCSLFLIGGSAIALLAVASVFRPITPTPDDISVRYPSPIGLPSVLYYDTGNPTVGPFIDAIDAVDRRALGFTPIAPHTPIALTWIVGKKAEYDVSMKVYGSTDRYIAFRQHNDTFTWVAEQEIHTGPNRTRISEGSTRETISITYETVYFSGASPNRIAIYYVGDDPRLTRKAHLTLQDVQPILQEWSHRSPTETPTRPEKANVN